MRRCSPGFRLPPTRAVGDAGPYDRVPEHRRNSGPRKAPLQGELSAEPTEGSPPHPRLPTVSHTGRRGRRPLRHGFGLPGSSGFRHCPTRATTRVAPTALFWDVCRGDPCGRPLLSASANARQEGRAEPPSKAPLQGELAAKPSEGSPPHPGFPTMPNPRAVGDAGPYGCSPEDCRKMKKFVPSHAAGIFHTRSVFHMTKEYFTRSARNEFHWPRQRPRPRPRQRPVLSSR